MVTQAIVSIPAVVEVVVAGAEEVVLEVPYSRCEFLFLNLEKEGKVIHSIPPIFRKSGSSFSRNENSNISYWGMR